MRDNEHFITPSNFKHRQARFQTVCQDGCLRTMYAYQNMPYNELIESMIIDANDSLEELGREPGYQSFEVNIKTNNRGAFEQIRLYILDCNEQRLDLGAKIRIIQHVD